MEQITPGAIADLTLLGGFTLTVDGKVLTDEINRSLKLWNVLTYLLVHRDRAVPQSELIETFWPGETGANPYNALKTLLYRIRAMLEPLFGDTVEPILAHRGAYAWNNAVPVRSDADRFEVLCHQVQTANLPAKHRLVLCREAYALYRGDFLPKLSREAWIAPLSAHYHGLYLELVKSMGALLEEAGEYEEMAEVAGRASALAPLDKELHALIVHAMLHQGREADALSHYESATDLLYRNLDVSPSEELQALYGEIMSVQRIVEADLDVIQKDLREAARQPGAFYCEYGFFREVYRLEARRLERTGMVVHLALLTVSLPGGGTPPLQALGDAMDQLKEVLVSGLRQGDVVSKCSGAQFLVMLPSGNFEDNIMVIERVISTFERKCRRQSQAVQLSYTVRSLD